MRITELSGNYIELTDAIRQYVENKIGMLEKFCEGYSPCDVRVEVGKTSEHHNKGKIWRAEYTLTLPGGTLRAEALEEDLYAAIDRAKDVLKQQLLEFKKRDNK